MTEYCGPTPACTSATVTKTDLEAVAGTEVFQIAVTGTGYTSLSYVIKSQYPDLFTVDPGNGKCVMYYFDISTKDR